MFSIRNTCAILGLCLLSLYGAVAATGDNDHVASPISLEEANLSLPDCARKCLLGAINQSPCAITDAGCICLDRKLNDQATACITVNCEVKEALTAKNITSHLCGLPVEADHSLIPTYAVFIGFAVVAVLLRIVARVLTQAFFWWDDLCNLFGFIGAAAFTVFNILSINIGQSKDIWFVSFDDITRIMQLFFGEMLLYTLTRFFVCASIILFYLRVFSTKGDNKLGRLVQYTMIFNVAYNISFFFAVVFQCTPIQLFWTRWESHHHDGHCGNANVLVWVAAVTGIAFDVWLLALPFPQLLALNLHWKKKIMGGMMFFVGAVVTIISLIRLKTINEFTQTSNPTRDIAQASLWSAIELDVGVICPCLPSFRLLLRRLLPRVMGTTGRYEMDPVSDATGAMQSGFRKSQANLMNTVGGGPGGGGGGGGHNHDNRVYVHTSIHVDRMSILKSPADGNESQDGANDTRSCASVTGLVGDSSDEESQKQGRGRRTSLGRR
ncbi:Repressed by TUP1 protein 5 [Madurella fahalii]|uniref:Repressed by TUP1 protein 5 n=1 Tax=Madurella fahalii TaxID=1157608 RepID=A0ABQ0GGL8_9PEZI